MTQRECSYLVERDVDNVRRDRGRRDKASGTLLLKDGTNRLHRVKDAVVVDRLDLAPLLEREVVDPARAALWKQR